MSTTLLPIIPPTLVPGYCFASWQQIANDLVGGALVQFSSAGFTVIITSASAPAATDRDKLWYKTGDNRLYQYDAGESAWVSRHPDGPGSAVRRLWTDTLGNLVTYDGGDAGGAGTSSGPMWVEDTDMIGRTAMHPGLVPGYDPLNPKTLALAENWGAGSITLTDPQIGNLATHQHVTGRFTNTTDDDNLNVMGATTEPYAGAGTLVGRDVPGNTNTRTTAPLSTLTGEYAITSPPYQNGVTPAPPTPHDNVPPVRGIYFIKRSTRVFYRG